MSCTPPRIVVHVLWRVTGFETVQAEALQKLLARQLGTDPAATPSTQLTRLPGFFNHKYASPHLVTVDYRQTDRILTPEAFPSIAPHDLPAPAEPPTRRLLSGQNLPVLERARCYLTQIPPAVAGAARRRPHVPGLLPPRPRLRAGRGRRPGRAPRLERPLPAAVDGGRTARTRSAAPCGTGASPLAGCC